MNVIRELIVSLGFATDNRGINQFEKRIHQLPNNVAPAFANLRNMIAGAFAGIAIGETIRGIVKAGDDLTTAINRIGESTTSPEAATAAFEELYASARETGVAMTETTKSFMRFAPAMRAAGSSDSTIIQMLDGLQKGLLAAGATAVETGSVLVQLGQAVNSNNFAGDELKSFMENASPALVMAFAEALGTTTSEIKKMGSEGKLNNATVLPALIASANAGRDSFGRMIVTVELAAARTRVAWVRFMGEFTKVIGLNGWIVQSFEAVGRSIDDLRLALPVIMDFINNILGLQNVVETLGIAFGIVLAPLAAKIALALMPLIAGAAVIGLLALTLQDLWAWSQGKESLFGRMLDQLNPEILEGFRQAWVDVAFYINLAWEALKSVADVLQNGLQGLLKLIFGEGSENLKSFNSNLGTTEGYLLGIVSALALVRAGMIALGWMTAGGAAAATAAAAGASIPSTVAAATAATGGGLGGTGAGAALLFDAMRRVGPGGDMRERFTLPAERRLRDEGPAETGGTMKAIQDWLLGNLNGGGLPQMPTGATLLPPAPTVNNNPVINQDITVTAPAADGASLGNTVGNAARNGAENAMRLGDSMARDLLRGNPATEAGAR